MKDDATSSLATQPLTQVQRVVDTFTEPSKTFTDILRNTSWWLPFLLGVLVSIGYCATVQKQVGWGKTYDNVLRQDPKAQARMANVPPASAANAHAIGAKITEISAYIWPALGLIIAAIAAAVLMATLNFGFGGHAKFSQLFAVWMYAGLPMLIKILLAIIALFAGLSGDSFLISNPVGTNVGYYLSTDAPRWLYTLASSIDIFTFWMLALLVIGCSIVGKIKRSSAAMAVIGWWLLILIVRTGFAAM
jgi:hypothetical protein